MGERALENRIKRLKEIEQQQKTLAEVQEHTKSKCSRCICGR